MILPPPAPPPTAAEALALAVLQRLPLAEAFYSLWGYVASDAVLQALFEQHRGRCYDDPRSFRELVAVLTDAVTRY